MLAFGSPRVTRVAVVALAAGTGCADTSAATGGAGGKTSNVSSASHTVASSATSTSSASTSTGSASSSASTGTAPSCPGKTGMSGDTTYTINVEGTDRTYKVHLPTGYDPEAAHRLVVVMHGYFMSSDQMETVTGLTTVSDEKGFIVVYPSGVSVCWNAGTCCGTCVAGDAPDVEFLGMMLDKIEQDLCIDPKRVYATGFSNGGMMSHRLACEVADRFAAIAPVSGTVAVDPCNPTRPVAVMHTHGSDDFVVPWDGGGFGGAASVPDTISGWVMRDRCTDAMPTTVYQNAGATCTEYSACQGGSAVRLCTLQGAGHEWPDGANGGGGVGTESMDLDVSRMMIDFFDQHPMP
jgi:polyhydroxybutyrate depolymerase